VKPRVLIDVDGVLANFVGATIRDMEAHHGFSMSHDDVTTWDIISSFPVDASRLGDTMRSRWREPGWCASIPVYEGAVEGISILRDLADVFFVTAPMSGAPHWMWERSLWLSQHFNADERDIVFTSSKHLVSGDVFVDDKPSNVMEWLHGHHFGRGVPVIWDRPYNRGYGLPPVTIRTSDWSVVASAVLGVTSRPYFGD
jgi:5'(3')-deoxyribonucleotidase